MMDEMKPSDFDLKNNFIKLSVQNDSCPNFNINPKFVDEYKKRTETKSIKTKKIKSGTKINLLIEDDDDSEEVENISLNDIKDNETLNKAVDIVIKNLKPN